MSTLTIMHRRDGSKPVTGSSTGGSSVAEMVQVETPQPPPMAATYAAYCDRAVKVYGHGETQVVALNEISVGFERGLFTAIMGPSGSGKSTLMHCMAGLDTLTAGATYIGDVNLATLREKQLTELRRDRIGFIFQAFNLVPTLNAIENITLPMALAGRDGDKTWVDEVIAAVGLGDRLKHRPSELSGGQQQRVAVARALASRPEIIYADDPTGNLDSRASGEILQFMRHAVADLGQTIVMVTHDPVSASYAGRIVFLADGVIVNELRNPSGPQAILDTMRAMGA
jgi:putative ABC transport system ATP-binding protein